MQEIIVYRSPVEPLMYEYGFPAMAVAIGIFATLYVLGLLLPSKFINISEKTKGEMVIAYAIFSVIIGFITLWQLL